MAPQCLPTLTSPRSRPHWQNTPQALSLMIYGNGRELSPRDRSLVTVAALIAGNQTAELAFHVGLALDNGVKPSEISGTVTHLAFYAGWGNAVAAAPIIKSVFEARQRTL